MRASVFLIEAKEPPLGGGVIGRLGVVGDDGVATRTEEAGVAAFFLPKDRKKDHSDSN